MFPSLIAMAGLLLSLWLCMAVFQIHVFLFLLLCTALLFFNVYSGGTCASKTLIVTLF